MKMNSEQLTLIQNQMKRLKALPGGFYQKKFDGIDVIRDQADFEKLPFTNKEELRDAYPLGIAAVPEEEIVRIHSSSGTTGTPVIIPYTKQDVEDWAELFKRCYEMAGITNRDRIHVTPGYGLWTAGIGFQTGAERLGAMVIPVGPGNTDKQLRMMQDMGSTVLCATSSYALLLAEEIAERETTVVISSHNLRELEDLCDQIGLLSAGKILFEKDLDALKLGFCRVQAAYDHPVNWEATGLTILDKKQRGKLVSLLVRGTAEATLPVLEAQRPLFAEALPMTLEEVFRFTDGHVFLNIELKSDAEGERIHIAESFEQDALALHHRHAGLGANVAQTQNGGAVGDHGAQVVAAGQLIGLVYILLNFQAGLGNAGGVGQGKIFLGGHGHHSPHFDFAFPLAVEPQGFFCVIHRIPPLVSGENFNKTR